MSIPMGMFNMKKCVQYLRHVGVEVSDQMASDWDLAERAHRFASLMKRTKRSGHEVYCADGHMGYVESRRGQKRKGKAPWKCPECGKPASSQHLRFRELMDGAVLDYRDVEERWKPLDDPRQT